MSHVPNAKKPKPRHGHDPKNLESITKAILKAINDGSMAMVLQLREMTDRIEGKVVQGIQAEVTTMNLAEAIAAARKRVEEGK